MTNPENATVELTTVTVAVRHLEVGDFLTGSGVTITRRPYTSTRLRGGRLHVEGVRQNKAAFRGEWNASTEITVQRQK